MKINVRHALLLIWLLILLSFRPGIPGEMASVPLFFVYLMVCGLFVLLFKDSRSLLTSKPRLLAVGFSLATLIYFFAQGLILGNDKGLVVNASVLPIGFVLGGVFVVNKQNTPILLKHFVHLHGLLAVSMIITFIIFIIVGFDYHLIPRWGTLGLYGRFADGSLLTHYRVVYFPFTLGWSAQEVLGIGMYRTQGIYKEPGQAQIFFATAFILTYYAPLKKGRVFLRVVLAIGTIITWSAAAFISLILGYIVLRLTNTNLKTALLNIVQNPLRLTLAISILAAAMMATGILVYTKFSKYTGKERVRSYVASIEAFAENPVFGQGYYNPLQAKHQEIGKKQQTLGLVGVSYQIGLIGLLLYLASWYWGVFKLSSKKAWAIYVACLWTVLLPQPSYNMCFVWFLIMLDTRQFTPILTPMKPRRRKLVLQS